MAGDIVNSSYLRRMRVGDPPHATVTLGNGNDAFDVEIVLLSNDKMTEIRENTDKRFAPKIVDGVEVRSDIDTGNNRSNYYNRLLCYHCMRTPDNINMRVAETPDEIASLLDDEDIKRVCDKYNELIVNKAPKLEVLTEVQIEELKKYLEVTPSKDLSTVSLIHLKYFHQTLVSEKCLMNSGYGSSSINE